jgi:hypothetical protein
MKIGSFKEYMNSVKGSPYAYLVTNTKEFKTEEDEVKKAEGKSDKEIEDERVEDNGKSLLQYLLYANAANQN